MENKLQNLKFRVYSEEHLKAIQDKLIEINIIGKTLKRKDVTHIFVDKRGCLTILDDNDDEYFVKHEYTLCTLDDLYKMQSEPNPQSELMTKLESLQKELDNVKEEISKLNK